MKRRYYRYDYTYDKNIIGKDYPQIDRLEGGFYYQTAELKGEKVLDHVKSETYSFPDSVFLGIGKVNVKSKLTDFILDRSSFKDLNVCYMIINNDILNILTQFNLGEFKTYHLPLLYRKKVYKYFYLALNNPFKVDEGNHVSLPDIIQIREGMYIIPYFSEAIRAQFEKRSSLGIEVFDSINI